MGGREKRHVLIYDNFHNTTSQMIRFFIFFLKFYFLFFFFLYYSNLWLTRLNSFFYFFLEVVLFNYRMNSDMLRVCMCISNEQTGASISSVSVCVCSQNWAIDGVMVGAPLQISGREEEGCRPRFHPTLLFFSPLTLQCSKCIWNENLKKSSPTFL